MSKDVFRKVSMERLSSPERLDELMNVTTSKGWFALFTLMFLAVAAVVWGIFGSLPTKVHGTGIMIKSGGVFKIVPQSTGQITDLRVSAGDTVHKGEIIARIGQPELLDKLRKTKARLEELENQHGSTVEFGTEDSRLQKDAINQQRKNLNSTIKSYKDQLKWLKEKIQVKEELLTKGLITKQELIGTKEQHDQITLKIKQVRYEFKQLSIKSLQLKDQREQRLSGIQERINSTKREIISLKEAIDASSRVVSPYTGRVLEVMVDIGDFTKAGSPVLSMELMGKEIKNLEAVLYIPAADGKKIKPGMDVQISPTTVKAEEYGFIKGKVTSVSEFPATYEGMMRVLNNSNLVQMLSGRAAPIEVYADLLPSDKTVSGLKWSSPDGPPMKIFSGTICSATVTVREQAPITLVIPLLKSYLLGYGN